ncbi:unnamed protein product [Ceutorhynchus assimilis]|uniref:Uncharacterized protein n=1 Tax=Ceutorhynchus assimilis TaxID=467358 RepID=A0A9P0DFR8_9CUCU|nr:unnamed protein product [Ceutorhynchus assimilis]
MNHVTTSELHLHKLRITLILYIAQHVSVLKRRLEYSYDTIPWEEMQFCLAMYVHILIKPEHSDIIYKLILKKDRILNYLTHFYEELEKINKQITETDLKRKRSFDRNYLKDCVLKKSPKFGDLYADFTLLKDIYSLNKIDSYIAKALRVSFKEDNVIIGQLVIERTLQVMGEYFKNTPDSPNLSDNLYKMLLKSSPRNLKTVLANLRNMLSHSFSLTRKLELENSKDPEVFEKVQIDLRKIQIDVIYFLYKQKIAAVKRFLRSFLNMEDIKDLGVILNHSNIEAIEEIIDYSINIEEFLKVKGLIDLFCQKISEESCDYFEEIEDIRNSLKTYESKVINVSSSYAEVLKKVWELINIKKDLNVIKNMIRTYLSLLSNSEPKNLYKDVYLKILHIQDDLQMKRDFIKENILNPDEKIVKINNIIIEIQGYIKLRLRRMKWIEEMEDDLSLKEDEIIEKYNEADQIFGIVVNKLETIQDKNVVQKAIEISRKRHSLKNELQIDSYEDMTNDVFTSKVSFLNLSVKRQKEILYNFEKKKIDKLKLMIKEIDDNYGAFLKKLGDMFPLVKYLNPIKAFYESFKFKNSLKRKIDKAIDEAIDEKIINSYRERLNRLQTILIYARKNRNDDLLMASLEMLVLDLMEFLANVKLLGDNKFLSVNASSILMGKQLRNFLAHGDILTDLSFYNNKISLMFHAEKLVQATETILSRKNIVVGYKANDVGIGFQIYFQQCQNVIRIQAKLFKLAKNYAFGELKQILEDGADMFGRSFDNWNILNFAIKEKNYLLFKNVMNYFDYNNTKEIVEALKFAIGEGNLNVTQCLVNNLPLDLICKIKNETTFLNTALMRGQKHVAEFLIEIGLKLDVKDLLYASENGYVEIVQMLIHDNDEKIYDYFRPLKLAVKNGHFTVTKILLNFVKNQPDRIALFNIAAQYSHLNLLKYFLKNNKHSNDDLTEAIDIATQHGNLQIIQFLLKTSNIKTSLNFIYLTASQYGHLNIIKWLIEKNIDINVGDNDGKTALHLASQCGHYSVVQQLLQHKINPSIQDNSGWSSLHWASNNKHIKIIKLLIENNINVLAQDKQGQTAFHLAVANGDMDVLTVLFKTEIKLMAVTNNKGQTALHLAAQYGHINIVEMLIESVNINAKNINDETPLIVATDNGHNDVVITLLKHKAETSCKTRKEGYSPITIASSHGHLDILNSLIKFKANIETEEHSGWRAIHRAVQNGYVDIFNALLKQNVNINAEFNHGGTALHTVMRNGHVEIAKKLVTHGADINALFFGNMLPLRIAAHFGHKSIAELLLVNGAKVDDLGNDKITPLHTACFNGHLEVVKLLIQHAANLNLKNNEEWTALHFAVKYGFIEIVSILLENSADMYAENNFYAKGFHIACEAGHNNIVKMFLNKYKMDVNVRGGTGVSGLHWASANNRNDVLNTLISHGADVNLRANDGSTPLHWAVDHLGSVNIIKTLIKNNALVNIQECKGASPLHLASFKGKLEAVEELIKHQAEVNLESRNTSPLHLAVAHGHYKIVHLLLKFKANVNSASSNNKTSLRIALEKGYTDIAQLLIQNNAYVNLRDIDGFDALHSAAQ